MNPGSVNPGSVNTGSVNPGSVNTGPADPDPAGANPVNPAAANPDGAPAIPFALPATHQQPWAPQPAFPASQPPAGPEWWEPTADRRRAPRKIADQLTIGLLIALTGVLLMAIAPPLARVLFLEKPLAAQRGIARAMWVNGYAVGPPPDNDKLRARDDMDLFPKTNPHEGPSPLSADAAFARKELALLSEPTAHGVTLGRVPEGATVMLIKRQGDWFLVARGGAADLLVGWVHSADVAILP